MTEKTDSPSQTMDNESPSNEQNLLDRANPLSWPTRFYVGILLWAGLLLLPVFVETTMTLVLMQALFVGMFAMSWDVVSGYTGEISFGHALFFAVGGYTSTILNNSYNLDPVVTIPVGMLLAVVASLVIGIPSLRLQGPYFSLLTLIAPLILLQIFTMFSGMFGGTTGLESPDPIITIEGDYVLTAVAQYYLTFSVFTVILISLLLVTRSNVGSIFTAIQENPDTVAAMGISVVKYKISAFVLSGAVGGFAGALFVHTLRGAPLPSQLLAVPVSADVIIASIVGGIGTITGAAVGGILLVLTTHYLESASIGLPFVDATIGDLHSAAFAILALILIYIAPGGILRWGIELGERITGSQKETPANNGGFDQEEDDL